MPEKCIMERLCDKALERMLSNATLSVLRTINPDSRQKLVIQFCDETLSEYYVSGTVEELVNDSYKYMKSHRPYWTLPNDTFHNTMLLLVRGVLTKIVNDELAKQVR